MSDNVRNVIIVGSGPAGLTAGIYAARAELKPLLIAGLKPGGQLTITNDVENFPGFVDPISGPALMENMRKQAERLGVEMLDASVEEVNFSSRPFILTTNKGEFKSKAVIVSTGSYASWIGLESEQRLIGRGVSGCATCDGFFYKDQEVVVVGGGDTAMEDADFLTRFASKVTIVHRREQLRASQILQNRTFRNPKIEFAWNSIVKEIVGKDQVEGVLLENVKTKEESQIFCQGVFVAIGHKPNTEIFKGQLDIDDDGYIITKKSTMETSIPGIFAAGDCQDKEYRQAILSAGTGCMAAIDADRFLCC
ncbi:MAG: thioredoxin-disulfide reductase [Pseudomonadota bacterium]